MQRYRDTEIQRYRDTEIQSSVRTSRCCETHTTKTDLCMLDVEDLAEVANLVVYAP